jgi:signal transduction histidine kinase
MTLTARLSLFFLGALALIVGGFATALYLMAERYFRDQVDESLDSALATLTAAAEIKPHFIGWNPADPSILPGQEEGTIQVRWMVHDRSLRPVARSRNLRSDDDLLADLSGTIPLANGLPVEVAWQGHPWQLRQRLLQASTEPRTKEQLQQFAEQIRSQRGSSKMVITVGVPLEPVQTLLGQLRWALAGLSLAIWLLAALVGRWFCRRALLPVTRMAQTVRSIGANNLEQRLPTAASGDELAELGQSFNDLLSRLQESFERQRRFSSDASHQLRTPLTAVLGHIDVALRRERTPEEYRQVLHTVSGQALQMRQIVETLLFLARANAEARLPTLVELSLPAWLQKHVEGWAEHDRFADLQLHYPADDPLVVMAQAPLLGQLVDNLWENACKYSESGTPITVGLLGEADAAVLTIADAGCGIAADDLPHVFEPFFRSQHVRRQGIGGIGLGLAVAQRIAVAFGGSITVESRLGEGTRFQVRLPRASQAPLGVLSGGSVNGQPEARGKLPVRQA